MSKDIYGIVAEKIIEQLEKGNIPWHKPWCGPKVAISHVTGLPYSMINQFLLDQAGEYLTFSQIQKEGGRVKKGAKSSMLVFWKMVPRKSKEGDTGDEDDVYPLLRYYNVFHISDTVGIEEKYPVNLPSDKTKPIEKAEEAAQDYLKRSGVYLRNISQDQSYYSPSRDMVVLPLLKDFNSSEEYYSTMFHELCHSTGHPSRLARFEENAENAAFGSNDYGQEELVAEIGSAAIMSALELETPDSFSNSAAYIGGWIKAIRGNPKMVISASSKAEKAAKLILGEKEEE